VTACTCSLWPAQAPVTNHLDIIFITCQAQIFLHLAPFLPAHLQRKKLVIDTRLAMTTNKYLAGQCVLLLGDFGSDRKDIQRWISSAGGTNARGTTGKMTM